MVGVKSKFWYSYVVAPDARRCGEDLENGQVGLGFSLALHCPDLRAQFRSRVQSMKKWVVRLMSWSTEYKVWGERSRTTEYGVWRTSTVFY